MSSVTNAQLPKERINALISAGVIHMNANNARATNSICTLCALQCLIGYALRPFFIDLAYSIAVKMTYQEINRKWRALSNSLEIAQQHNLRFNFDRTLEQARIEELIEHIHKLEDTAQEKSNSRAKKSSPRVKERVRRTKKVIVKVSSSRATRRTSPSPNSSPSLDEEAAPTIPKRKRSSLERKTSITFGAGVKQSRPARLALSLPEEIVLNEPTPNLIKMTICPSRNSRPYILDGLILTPKPLLRPQNQFHPIVNT